MHKESRLDQLNRRETDPPIREEDKLLSAVIGIGVEVSRLADVCENICYVLAERNEVRGGS